MVPWSHWRQPFSGWMLTVLTSEFTHFNLVIRLSNVQQLALLFCTFFENSRGSGRPRDPSDLFLSQREIVRNNQKLLFATAATFAASSHHVTTFESGRHTSCRCGILSFWFSGEVKHIVHLSRWNLEAVYAFYGWPEHGPGLAQRTNFRFRNWILF